MTPQNFDDLAIALAILGLLVAVAALIMSEPPEQ